MEIQCYTEPPSLRDLHEATFRSQDRTYLVISVSWFRTDMYETNIIFVRFRQIFLSLLAVG